MRLEHLLSGALLKGKCLAARLLQKEATSLMKLKEEQNLDVVHRKLMFAQFIDIFKEMR